MFKHIIRFFKKCYDRFDNPTPDGLLKAGYWRVIYPEASEVDNSDIDAILNMI